VKTEILQFLLANGSGNAAIRQLAYYSSKCGPSAAESLCTSAFEINRQLGIKPQVAEGIINSRNEAIRLSETLYQNNIQLLWIGEEQYPKRLRNVLGNDAPPVLFVKGDINLFQTKAVGFCGARDTSEKGLSITKMGVEQLVLHKHSVVSGYAKGVDMTAHETAVLHNGNTIIVLAEGILKFSLKKCLKSLLKSDNHLFISQFPPYTRWLARNAMERNKTIIGLSNTMILVESNVKGGTYEAGKETIRRNIPLFVVDYAKPEKTAAANKYFLSEGGLPLRGNLQGVPNLKKLFEITNNPRLRSQLF